MHKALSAMKSRVRKALQDSDDVVAWFGGGGRIDRGLASGAAVVAAGLAQADCAGAGAGRHAAAGTATARYAGAGLAAAAACF